MCNDNLCYNNLRYNGIHHFEEVYCYNTIFKFECLNERYVDSNLYQVKFVDQNLRGFCNPTITMVVWANNTKDAINKAKDWSDKYNTNLRIGCSELLEHAILERTF